MQTQRLVAWLPIVITHKPLTGSEHNLVIKYCCFLKRGNIYKYSLFHLHCTNIRHFSEIFIHILVPLVDTLLVNWLYSWFLHKLVSMVKGKIPKSTEVFRECDEKSPTMKNNKGRGPRKKIVKSLVFCQTGGSRRVVKSQTSILEKYFFSEHVKSF